MFRQMFEEKYMRFPDGKSKALSFSYDDGVKADKKLIKLFDKYNLKGTFNLNSLLFDCENWHDRMDEEQTYNTFNNTKHEVAMHGARHIFLNKVPLAEAANEIVQNRVYLENRYNRIVRGLAYAYSGYNGEIIDLLKKLGVDYARTTEATRSFALPEDFMRWHPTCHHADGELSALADRFFNSSPEEDFKHREPWLFLIWGHSYEFEDNGNWHIIEDFCKRAEGRDDVWYATCGEISEYCRAYQSLVWSMDGERVKNPAYMPVFVEIRGKVYKIPAGGEVAFQKEI